MKMDDWGNHSVPTLMVPKELKNHQVIKEEVRHFVSPSSRRPLYKRVNSLPNINHKRGESRWQNSSSESMAAQGESPAFRGVHSPSSARRILQLQNSSEINTSKTKSSHKKRGKISSSSAHERMTTDCVDDKRSVHKRRGKKDGDTTSKSVHESRTRVSLLDDDEDLKSSTGAGRRTAPLHHDARSDPTQDRSSRLFESDSFIGTIPLGGKEKYQHGNDKLVATCSGAYSSSSPHAGAWCAAKQPIKSAMRKKRGNDSQPIKDSNESSLSSMSFLAQENPDECLSVMAYMESSGSSLALPFSTSVPHAPRLTKTDERWTSNSPVENQYSQTASPKRPGRVASEGSISLAAGAPPFANDDDDDDIIDRCTKEDLATPADTSVAGSKLIEDCLFAMSRPTSGRSLIHDVVVDIHSLQQRGNAASPANKKTHEQAVCGVMNLTVNDVAGSVPKQAQRRGSTGALAQKWEEKFPCKTPILPQSTPTTPKDSSRKRFNHRRRGSFGIFSNIADQEEETIQPKETTKNNGDDDYDLFLQSGATGDFSTWLNQNQKGKKPSQSTQASPFRPPAERRGSAGALAQRWEQELLPSLQSTTPPLTPSHTSKRRGSGSMQGKQQSFEAGAQERKSSNVDPKAKANSELLTPRRESRRRGSMGALVEKWEKLKTPTSSPKDPWDKMKSPSPVVVDLSSDSSLKANKSQTINTSIDVVDGSSTVKRPPIKPPLTKVPFLAKVGSNMVKEEESPPIVKRKQRRRGSTGVLETQSGNDSKGLDGATTSPASGKRRTRRLSMGNLADVSSEKKKKANREKGSTLKSSKKKGMSESKQEFPSLLSPPSNEQSAGEVSKEKASRRSLTSFLASEGDEDYYRTKVPSVDSNSKKTKKKPTNDTDLSKRSTDSRTTKTSLTTCTSELDHSKRSTGSFSSKVRETTTQRDGLMTSTSSESKKVKSKNGTMKLKKRSNSAGSHKGRVKKSSMEGQRSRSDGLIISAVDSEKIKEKKRARAQGKLREVQQNIETA